MPSHTDILKQLSKNFQVAKNIPLCFLIILSVSPLFFLQNSEARAAEVSNASASKFDAVLTASTSFSKMLEEKGYANHLFIFKLNAILEKHKDICPQDIYAFARDLKTLSTEIRASEAQLKDLYSKFDALQIQLQKAQKKKKSAQIEKLLAEISGVNKKIFETEGSANQLYPVMLPYYETLYAGIADRGCPDDMIFIDGTYCVDKYEYPNKKGSLPVLGVNYDQAAKLCGSEGKRLCSGTEWARACAGPACKQTVNTLRPFNASECNIISNSRTMVLPPSPTGDSTLCDTPEGVSDMLANAWEWTTQDYKSGFKIVQGGVQKFDRSAACSSREWSDKSDAAPYYGLRCCSASVALADLKAPAVASGTKSWTLTSSAFAEGAPIPERHTCDGANISPALSWTEPPEGTKELLLIVDDPDAPRGTWTHWVVYKMSPDLRGLPESFPSDPLLETPVSAAQGLTSFGKTGYGGPCPPTGKHRYLFKLYALKTPLELPESAEISTIKTALPNNILLETELMGAYSKR